MLLTFYSSQLLLLPILYYLFYMIKTMIHTILICFVFINYVLSILFWKKPMRYSLIHRLDSTFAKLSIVSIIFYILSKRLPIQYLCIFINIILIMSVFFYLSNYYSKEWCCDDHIYMHFSAHIFANIALFFMFL